VKEFQPGFRCSYVDVGVLALGAIVAVTARNTAGGIVAFVVAHFFLFCNVFRVSRRLELAWSGLFVALAGCTIAFERPSWLVTISVTLLATVLVIALTMRKPSYHGVLWRTINPALPEWWARNQANPAIQERG
jgi:hypothetical protein